MSDPTRITIEATGAAGSGKSLVLALILQFLEQHGVSQDVVSPSTEHRLSLVLPPRFASVEIDGARADRDHLIKRSQQLSDASLLLSAAAEHVEARGSHSFAEMLQIAADKYRPQRCGDLRAGGDEIPF